MTAPLNIARVYDEHAQALHAFLLNLSRNEADTRDLLQELFVKLARQPDLGTRIGFYLPPQTTIKRGA